MKMLTPKKIILTICMTIFFCCLGQTNGAQPPNYKLSDFKLGAVISGEAEKLNNLDGKVVVIEYWGTR